MDAIFWSWKIFFANINMKLKNPMDPSEGVVELAME